MATNNKSIFAINMVRIRKERGWSQREAAHKIGIKRATLGSYEEDRAEPPYDTLLLICKAYKVRDIHALITNPDFLIAA